MGRFIRQSCFIISKQSPNILVCIKGFDATKMSIYYQTYTVHPQKDAHFFCFTVVVMVRCHRFYLHTLTIRHWHWNNHIPWYPKSRPEEYDFTIHHVKPSWNCNKRTAKIKIRNDVSMAWCKTTVTPVRWQWSYCSLALHHRYMQIRYVQIYEIYSFPGLGYMNNRDCDD